MFKKFRIYTKVMVLVSMHHKQENILKIYKFQLTFLILLNTTNKVSYVMTNQSF
jgi:hypothetical protein